MKLLEIEKRSKVTRSSEEPSSPPTIQLKEELDVDVNAGVWLKVFGTGTRVVCLDESTGSVAGCNATWEKAAQSQ